MNTVSVTPGSAPHDAVWQRRVARAFDRAAPYYRRRAVAQHRLGEHLWRRLPARATHILDLGCGPGDWTRRLSERYATTAFGVDLAPAMLEQARRSHGSQGHWLCADATRLPLASAGFDLVFSNLAIQWCRNLPALFEELHRVLAPGGRGLINTLGPGTLAEVAHAWSRPDCPAALQPFTDTATYRGLARQAGLDIVIDAAHQCFHYPDLPAVMDSIKGVGAQVARSGPRLRRGDISRAEARFETLREPAGLPVTYHRLTLELVRPPETTP
ncbi:methyltransferase domain-containing protein [Modicisalibacter coralii]|uniref:methyltransferase domain-containing protein n=1 Tax=Modicisalibacter coralii TaxID=2304602 RepID=UPI00100BF8CC|nr:methyltransferase domain-containing protein [Halomonas coralii]